MHLPACKFKVEFMNQWHIIINEVGIENALHVKLATMS